jgi:energy-coupling factor transporter ATP-binding protein EcfA2
MSPREAHFLDDEPVEEDAFGSHLQVASSIARVIQNDTTGKAMALLGEWGSGKSTVVRIVEKIISKSTKAKEDTVIIKYDAWSHEGDILRMSFLDNIVETLTNSKSLNPDKANRLKTRIWQTAEKETTTTHSRVTIKGILVLISFFFVMPLGLVMLESSDGSLTSIFHSSNLQGILLFLSPFIVHIIASIIESKVGSKPLRQNLYPGSMLQVVSGSNSDDTTEVLRTVDRSSEEFRKLFSDILSSSDLAPNSKILLVVDNIDRLEGDALRGFWSTLVPFFEAIKSRSLFSQFTFNLLIPFSNKALEKLLFIENVRSYDSYAMLERYDDSSNRRLIDGLLEKTFDIRFNIRSIELFNWRTFLRRKIKLAFPWVTRVDLSHVTTIFSQSPKLNPRAIITFINNMATCVIATPDDIPLKFVAAYCVSKISYGSYSSFEDLGKIGHRFHKTILKSTPHRRSIINGSLYYSCGFDRAERKLLLDNLPDSIKGGNYAFLRDFQDADEFDELLRYELEKRTNEIHGQAGLSNILKAIGSLSALKRKNIKERRALLRRLLKLLDYVSNTIILHSDLTNTIETLRKFLAKRAFSKELERLTRVYCNTPIGLQGNADQTSDSLTAWLDGAVILLKIESNIINWPNIIPQGSQKEPMDIMIYRNHNSSIDKFIIRGRKLGIVEQC